MAFHLIRVVTSWVFSISCFILLLPGGYRDIFKGVPKSRRSQFGIDWTAGEKRKWSTTTGRGYQRQGRIQESKGSLSTKTAQQRGCSLSR